MISLPSPSTAGNGICCAVGHRRRLPVIHVLQPRLGARIQGKLADRDRAVQQLFAVIAQPAAAVAPVLPVRAANLAIPVADEGEDLVEFLVGLRCRSSAVPISHGQREARAGQHQHASSVVMTLIPFALTRPEARPGSRRDTPPCCPHRGTSRRRRPWRSRLRAGSGCLRPSPACR